MESETDESTLALGIMLPDNETTISFDGHTMTMGNARGEWRYELRHEVITDSDAYGANDLLLITKSDEMMNVVSL